MVVLPLAADIGEITELRGNGAVIRDDTVPAFLEQDIKQMDDVRTANGRLGITFIDDSQVRLTEHSKLIIDEIIFDPDPEKSKMAMQFASGTARFITGKIGQINKQNIDISTPTAQIAIRGTDFTVTVDEFGKSLVILLPDANGLPSGEIIVSTAMGSTVLLDRDHGTISGHVGRSLRDRKIMAVFPDGNHGKEAITHYQVIERFGFATFVSCRLETGRTHQIRVHFQSIGHSLFGDQTYGGDQIPNIQGYPKFKSFIENCLGICPRQALNARLLGFIHPKTLKNINFEIWSNGFNINKENFIEFK